MSKRLNKKYLLQLRSELLIQWNVVGSKIELIDHLLEEPHEEDE